MTNHDQQERWRLEALADKLQRDLTHAEVSLKATQHAELYLAEKLDTAEASIEALKSVTRYWEDKSDRLEALADKLQRQNDQLRDIVRASQYLIDIINYQQNATGGGTYSEALDNLKAALRAWYEPNGSGR